MVFCVFCVGEVLLETQKRARDICHTFDLVLRKNNIFGSYFEMILKRNQWTEVFVRMSGWIHEFGMILNPKFFDSPY